MAVLEILKYPHPGLKKKCENVCRIDEETLKLVRDMTETMYHANGVGLAASQVGVHRRVIVLDVSPMDPEKEFMALINPELLSGEGEIEYEEGCLSVPECVEKLTRQAKVQVRGLTPEGKVVEVEGEGILAIALQHELDHLNGTLIIDRVSRLKRELYRRKVQKERKREKEEE
jgi:peptide deformylase